MLLGLVNFETGIVVVGRDQHCEACVVTSEKSRKCRGKNASAAPPRALIRGRLRQAVPPPFVSILNGTDVHVGA